ncbi:hypothetical protein ADE_11680 [Achromobacter denitrificans]|nr:hypothetical protein ADE_11680 [Achromobacter denitrificans]
MWFEPAICTFVPKSSADAAAWVQALASGVAIFASAWLALHIQSRDIRLKRKGSATLAFDISLTARTILSSIHESFSDQQKVHEFASGQKAFDREALNDLYNMVAGLDMQAIQEPALVRPLLMLRTSVRKVRDTLNEAFAMHQVMNARDFTMFFDILRNQAKAAHMIHNRISAAAETI